MFGPAFWLFACSISSVLVFTTSSRLAMMELFGSLQQGRAEQALGPRSDVPA